MTQASEVEQPTQEPNQASSQVENAQEPSLDDLLSEYNETPAEPEKETPAAAPSIPPEIEAFMARQMQQEEDTALADAARMVKKEFGETQLTEDWFEAHLYRAGAKDKRIQEAFTKRHQNPGAWNTILSKIGKDLRNSMTPVDQQSTDSWNAVEASVHSSSTSNPQKEETPDIKAMSDAEFNAYKKQLMRGK